MRVCGQESVRERERKREGERERQWMGGNGNWRLWWHVAKGWGFDEMYGVQVYGCGSQLLPT